MGTAVVADIQHRYPHPLGGGPFPFTFSMLAIVRGLAFEMNCHVCQTGNETDPEQHGCHGRDSDFTLRLLQPVQCAYDDSTRARTLHHSNFVNSPLATLGIVKECSFAQLSAPISTKLVGSLAGLVLNSVLRNRISGAGFRNHFQVKCGRDAYCGLCGSLHGRCGGRGH